VGDGRLVVGDRTRDATTPKTKKAGPNEQSPLPRLTAPSAERSEAFRWFWRLVGSAGPAHGALVSAAARSWSKKMRCRASVRTLDDGASRMGAGRQTVGKLCRARR